MRALLFSMLAGCSLVHGTPASTPSTPSSSAAPDDRVQPQDSDKHAFLPEDFDALKGLSVDQAKAEAKKRGHRGEVRVEQLDDFAKTCKANSVCIAEDVRGGQSGMGLDEPLVLKTNKQSTIAIPTD